jgi:hypothetical protein
MMVERQCCATVAPPDCQTTLTTYGLVILFIHKGSRNVGRVLHRTKGCVYQPGGAQMPGVGIRLRQAPVMSLMESSQRALFSGQPNTRRLVV